MIPWAVVVLGASLLAASLLPAAAAPAPLTIGAVYPTAGPQASVGIQEFRGVELAAAFANARGGARGRPILLILEPAADAAAAPRAVARLVAGGAAVIAGSHGSTISGPAAEAAAKAGVVFWETGAVGDLAFGAAPDSRVFRYAPMGSVLGRAAVSFVHEQVTPRLGRRGPLRYAVPYVDDAYGRSVARGAMEEIRHLGLPLAALPYDLRSVDFNALADRIAASRADVLVVASYLQDAVAMRWAIVGRRVPLAVGIGTSSSYCMPAFGAILGEHAVGLFASDKPDADVMRLDRLTPGAATALRWARVEYRRRFGEPMGSAALSGFSGGLALFRHVLPAAAGFSPDEIAAAARRAVLPEGTLPDGAGLAFGPPGGPEAGNNLRAARVIWQWVRPGVHEVVWPPAFATHPIVRR